MAAGRRVLVSGMGGDLGSRVAVQLEHEDWVGELVGIDVDPPRRRLHRADFHLISPVEHDRTVETITAFDPHVVGELTGGGRVGARMRLPHGDVDDDVRVERSDRLDGAVVLDR